MHTIRQHSASAAFEVRDNILIIHFSGPMTATVLKALRSEMLPYATHAKAIVADYRSSTLAMSEDCMWRMIHAQHDDNVIDMPTAIVGDAVQREMFGRIALLAALRYRRRRLVTGDLAQATEWARSALVATS